MPPPTEAGGPTSSGGGVTSGGGSESASDSGSSPSPLSPFFPSSVSSSYSSSPNVDDASEEERVCSLSRPERSGRLEGTSNSGQSPPWAADMKLCQIGPAVGPP